MAQLLKDIRGQAVSLKLLLKAIENKHLPHALLFAGPSGIGKKKSAWALAQTLLCPESFPACGECYSCGQVEKQINTSVLFIAPETLEIKAGSVRAILDFLSLQSFSPARVVIIDSAHQMNRQASNSLLKILEEPPANVYFFLISSKAHDLSLTIRSRSQMVLFTPLKKEDIAITSSSEDWMLNACQGRMDILEKLREKTEMRKQAFSLLKNELSPHTHICSFKELADSVKNREQALFICLCWQQIWRDARILQLKASHQIIHADHRELIKNLSKLPAVLLNTLFQQTSTLEKNLRGYMDPVLLFDNFMLHARKKIQQTQSTEKKAHDKT